MYKVVITEHFECWLVIDENVGEFNTIEEAMGVFCEVRRNIIENKYSTSGINKCISENFGDDYDEDWNDDQYSQGFMIWMYNDDEEIVSQHFDYEPKSHSIKEDSQVELHHENLTEKEAKILANYGIG